MRTVRQAPYSVLGTLDALHFWSPVTARYVARRDGKTLIDRRTGEIIWALGE